MTMTINTATVLRVGGAGAAAAGLVYALDAGTKSYVNHHVPDEYTHNVLPGIGYGNIHNAGFIYGQSQAKWWERAGVGVAVTAVGVGLVVHSGHRVAGAIGAGIMLGGTLGNVLEERKKGYITDMIHTTPLFAYYNVADAALWTGLGVAILSGKTGTALHGWIGHTFPNLNAHAAELHTWVAQIGAKLLSHAK
jgi:lipoprotein signal peptidase